MNDSYLKECLDLYKDTLLNNIIPFWIDRSIDRENGGISNVMDDEGTILSTEKFIWSQGRVLWTFAAVYNRVEPREEHLEAAEHVYRFLSENGRDESGYWNYRLDENGGVLEKDISIYVDGFVLNGMTEYYRASLDEIA